MIHTENTEDLERHIKVKHVVDDIFKYPESTEEDIVMREYRLTGSKSSQTS